MTNKIFKYIFAAVIVAALLPGCRKTPDAKLKTIGEITVQCPDAVKYLPGFPSFDDKEAFFNDSLLYRRGQKLRQTERGHIAVEDAGEDLDFYLARFSKVLGVTLSKERTPAIARYIATTITFTRSGISNAKAAFGRQRPFFYFGEPSGIPADENRYGEFSSYPSGHSLRGWAIALALIAIDEEHQYEILKLGYELGENRVIVGYHFESDVSAARLAASVGFAKITSDEQYIKLMKLARQELSALSHSKPLLNKN